MLSVSIMLNVIMLSVVAPLDDLPTFKMEKNVFLGVFKKLTIRDPE
jgi:hypothetical protein